MNNTEFQQYVLEKLDKIADDVGTLKGKSYLWGALAGALSAIFTVLMTYVTRKP